MGVPFPGVGLRAPAVPPRFLGSPFMACIHSVEHVAQAPITGHRHGTFANINMAAAITSDQDAAGFSCIPPCLRMCGYGVDDMIFNDGQGVARKAQYQVRPPGRKLDNSQPWREPSLSP